MTANAFVGDGSGLTNLSTVRGGTIAGGGYGSYPNQITANYATVSGGINNTGSGVWATVGGGAGNTASRLLATVAGGDNNTPSGGRSTVGGGDDNTAGSGRATVGGGENNTAGGQWSTVPGGSNNTAGASYSFAAGRRAKTWCGPYWRFPVFRSERFRLHTDAAPVITAFGQQGLGLPETANPK